MWQRLRFGSYLGIHKAPRLRTLHLSLSLKSLLFSPFTTLPLFLIKTAKDLLNKLTDLRQKILASFYSAPQSIVDSRMRNKSSTAIPLTSVPKATACPNNKLTTQPTTQPTSQDTNDSSTLKTPQVNWLKHAKSINWRRVSRLISRLIETKNFQLTTPTPSTCWRYLVSLWYHFKSAALWVLDVCKRSTGDAVIILRGLVITLAVDSALTDDEPLWEPVEWSLVQVWIMFVFIFAWIAENLIASRYASYTGRDKRIWFSWYKTFWLVEAWYIMSLGAAALLVITPFYHEITYTMPLVLSWWNWYSRVFFLKFIATYALVIYLAHYLQSGLGSFHWRKSLAIIVLINLFLLYLLYTHFLMSFFAYFTDPSWYSKTRLVDYIYLSHEPNKWSWGSAKRDHFSYHRSTTVFWFKNDGPFGAALLLFHITFFISLFNLYIFWITLLRRVYTTKEVPFTFTTYCVSALRQFFYFFMFFFLLAAFSLVVHYWRLPIEYSWIASTTPIFGTFCEYLLDYPHFLLSIILG